MHILTFKYIGTHTYYGGQMIHSVLFKREDEHSGYHSYSIHISVFYFSVDRYSVVTILYDCYRKIVLGFELITK